MNRSHRSFRRSVLLVLAMLTVMLTVPFVASAQSPTDEQYGNGVLGVAAGGSDDGGSDTGGSTSGGSTTSGGISELPFTGLDVAAVAAIGLGLVGAGLVVRRAARSSTDLA